MFILDTDTLGHLFRGHERVVKRVELVNDDVCTSVITRFEILRARFAFLLNAKDGNQLVRAQEWLNESQSLLAGFRTVLIDRRAADEFDALRSIRGLRKIGRPDLLIASVARANSAVLVTRNV